MEVAMGIPTPVIACVLRSGGIYTADWVHRLANGVRRHTKSMPYRFVCLTDMEVPGIETIPLIHGWPGWWSKIELFRPELFGNRSVLYLDLDTVVVGDLEQIAIAGQGMTMMHEPRRPRYFNSSVMQWWRTEMCMLYREFVKTPEKYMHRFRSHPRIGDQAFISDYLVKQLYLPCAFRDSVGPDAVLSYKHDRCELGPRPTTAVVSFHGKPKPCDFKTGWVADAWR
jgi:hypothetical protein